MDSTNKHTPANRELQAQIGSTSDPVVRVRDLIPSLPPGVPTQSWTLSGYPIVDNKYHDLATDEIIPHSGPSMGGPPSISVYWQNRLATGRRDQFLVISKTVASTTSLSEYIIRVGDLLRKGACKVDSMNVTRFNVYMVVQSELGQDEFRQALNECGLL
ncbi:hypothetical protein B0T18DRAFT_405877 [Schizothecium vesticola]|uniref:Uncharacterized protein n=1 Tax=Schizothecium vesticola TaxID=314040 RepID=A0AA40K7X6_9PEZI|nr:hypothetical protein B0T18DRAFT_405877 [Schizothecium vesticola]